MTTETLAPPATEATGEPRRARAVLSSADFALIRKAVAHYLETGPAGEDMAKLGHLYHRLGSAAR